MKHTINYSEIERFKRCRQLWNYADQLDLEPLVEARERILGTAIHHALDRYYGFGEHPTRTFLAWWDNYLRTEAQTPQAFSDDCALGVGMLNGFAAWASDVDRFRAIHTEYTFEVAIPGTSGALKGRIDGIAQDEYGGYWIMEHKTCKNLPYPDHLHFDEQTVLYQWAMQRLIARGQVDDIPSDALLEGVIWTGLRKVLPKRPELVEKGKRLSRVKIATTYEVYLATILAYNFDPVDYQAILLDLQTQQDVFFRRDWHTRGRTELEAAAYELTAVYQEMRRESIPIFRTANRFNCERCDFREPCQLAQKGGHIDDLLRTAFSVRDQTLDDVTEEAMLS